MSQTVHRVIVAVLIKSSLNAIYSVSELCTKWK